MDRNEQISKLDLEAVGQIYKIVKEASGMLPEIDFKISSYEKNIDLNKKVLSEIKSKSKSRLTSKLSKSKLNLEAFELSNTIAIKENTLIDYKQRKMAYEKVIEEISPDVNSKIDSVLKEADELATSINDIKWMQVTQPLLNGALSSLSMPEKAGLYVEFVMYISEAREAIRKHKK